MQEAKRLTDIMIASFYDNKDGGFFFTANESEKVLIRNKEIYDGAVPSGNSVAAYALIRLFYFTSEKNYKEKAVNTIKAFSKNIKPGPISYAYMMMAVDYLIGPSSEIIISTSEDYKNNSELSKTLKAINTSFNPNKIIILNKVNAKNETENDLSKLSPFVKNQVLINNKTTYYI